MDRLLAGFLFRFRSPFRRQAVERELDDELRFHLERQSEKYVRLGLTPPEAVLV